MSGFQNSIFMILILRSPPPSTYIIIHTGDIIKFVGTIRYYSKAFKLVALYPLCLNNSFNTTSVAK